MSEPEKIPLGISSCLMGDSVRFNGGHKHSRFCTDVLSQYFEFHAYCPEVAIGMGIPREPVRLVGDRDNPRVVGTKDSSIDVTDALSEYAQSVLPEVKQLCGYIFMKDSPSCGVFSTKVYNHKGGINGPKRSGVFAAVVCAALPNMPVEEEGRLNDPLLRENFIARVFVYYQLRKVLREPSPAKLVEFHSQHKFFTMSYSQSLYKQLGRMVATAGSADIAELCQSYEKTLMSATLKPPSRKNHVNVLYHLVGYLKETVPGGIRQDLTDAIEEYRKRLVPLAVPMKLMNHYIENYAGDYIKNQSYLNPYPYELGLRNGI